MSYLMIDGATSTVDSDVLSTRTTPRNWAIEVLLTSSVETDVSVSLQGSISQETWFDMATHTLSEAERTNKGSLFVIVDMPLRNIRISIDSFSALGTITVRVEPEVLA